VNTKKEVPEVQCGTDDIHHHYHAIEEKNKNEKK